MANNSGKGPRQVQDLWWRGQAHGETPEGLAMWYVSQSLHAGGSLTAGELRERLWRSEPLRLEAGNPEHVARVDMAVRTALAWQRSLSAVSGDNGELVGNPDVRYAQGEGSRFAYTVTGEIESTDPRNPGTLYRTMVLFGPTQLSAEEIVDAARLQGGMLAGRTKYFGRRGDWESAVIRLNLIQRTE